MSDETTHTQEYVLEKFDYGFLVVWEATLYHATAKVYNVVARRSDNVAALFTAAEIGDPVEDLSLAEIYMDIMVKWDGCSHVNSPGYWHWCGPEYYHKHIALVEYLYKRAFELMGREPEEPW